MAAVSWEGVIVNNIYCWYFKVYQTVFHKCRKVEDSSNVLVSQDLRLVATDSSNNLQMENVET